MGRRCRHSARSRLVWRTGGGDTETWFDAASWEGTDAIVCNDCGAWLPLGPSSDDDERVQVEIRAAEIAADFLKVKPRSLEGASRFLRDLDGDELSGWIIAQYDSDKQPGTAAEWSGWLARAIATHEEDGNG